jgi:spore coat polysaccharide biosynthesis protein SpsF
MENKIIGIIQCRMGAARLPNKMLLPLKGVPIIEWVIKRVSRSQRLNMIICAIPEGGKDDVLEKKCRELGVHVFRGSEPDLASRFYGAAKDFAATHIVRVCADNPFISPELIDELVDFYFGTGGADYAYNHIPRDNKFPDGLGAEIVSFALLEDIFQNARGNQREHVFNYIWDNREKFNIRTYDPKFEELMHPELKLDLDTDDDYRYLSTADVDIAMAPEEIVKAFLEKK